MPEGGSDTIASLDGMSDSINQVTSLLADQPSVDLMVRRRVLKRNRTLATVMVVTRPLSRRFSLSAIDDFAEISSIDGKCQNSSPEDVLSHPLLMANQSSAVGVNSKV